MYLACNHTNAGVQLCGGVIVSVRGERVRNGSRQDSEKIILVACDGIARGGVAHKGTVVGAEVSDLAVGLGAQVGGIVARGRALVERVGKCQGQQG